MKKEVILAIAIGFVLGLIITFGIWTANKSLKQLPKTTPTPSPAEAQALASPTPSSSTTLTLTSPDDELLTNQNSITVSGTTFPNATVTITYELGEQIVTADTSGKFSIDVNLDGGYNTITATAFDAAGNSASQSITVTYTTSKI